jgi:RNA methyltransferase, TrmH family
MTLITSRQHAIVKRCRAIARGDSTQLLLDGWHLIEDARAVGLDVELVAVRDDVAADHAAALARMAAAGMTIARVSDRVMDAISPVRTSSGVIAIAHRPRTDARALLAPAPALVVAAIGVQDPGNVGALIRSADAGGATGVLLDTDSADPWGWKALRASMGSAFRLPVMRAEDAPDHLRQWRDAGLAIVATDPHTGVDVQAADLTGPLVFVMGAEGTGLPATAMEAADVRVRIPMRARVESLNVAVAAALLVYEAARQRGQSEERR